MSSLKWWVWLVIGIVIGWIVCVMLQAPTPVSGGGGGGGTAAPTPAPTPTPTPAPAAPATGSQIDTGTVLIYDKKFNCTTLVDPACTGSTAAWPLGVIGVDPSQFGDHEVWVFANVAASPTKTYWVSSGTSGVPDKLKILAGTPPDFNSREKTRWSWPGAALTENAELILQRAKNALVKADGTTWTGAVTAQNFCQSWKPKLEAIWKPAAGATLASVACFDVKASAPRANGVGGMPNWE